MVCIRKARESDFEGVLNLAKELYNTEVPFDKNLKTDYYDNQEARGNIKKSILSRKKTFLVAYEDNNIVGYAEGYILDGQEYVNRVAYLNHLCVSSKFRKKGIGKMLIDEFTKIMKEKDVKYIKLNAFEGNTPAVSLYKKENFKEYSIYYIKEIG